MFRTRALVASLIALSALAGAEVAAADPTWVTVPTSRMHQSPAATVLGDGSVLLIGDAQTVERFDPVSDRWTVVAGLTEPHSGAAVTLRDGRVLVAGGVGSRGPMNTAELYSPATNTWTPAEPMNEWRSSQALVPLDDGRALAVGGYTALAGEIYDPGTGHWTKTKDAGMVRYAATVTKLADGRVLLAGADDPPNIFAKYTYASAEIYDPKTDAWTPAASMHVERAGARSALLPDGRVLVAGGFNRLDQVGAASTFEIYEPAGDTWTVPARLPRQHRNGAMTRLSDGRLVLTGGLDVNPAGPIGGIPDNAADLFDPRTGTWSSLPSMAERRFGHVAVTLTDDSVLVAGGGLGATSERLYFTTPPVRETPTPPTPPKTKPKPGVIALTASKRLKPSRTGVITVTARCTGETTCRGGLRMRLGARGRTLATADVTVAPGKTATIRIRLAKADRRRLAKRAMKVTLTLGARTVNATLRAR